MKLKLFEKINIYREDGEIYLQRINIIRTDFISIRLHHILRDDDECLHDHPWNFISFILWGGYWETAMWPVDYDYMAEPTDYPYPPRYIKRLWYGPLNILYRKAEWQHRLEVPKPAWTFVISFKNKQKWGFFTSKGKIPHNEYTSTGKCD